MKLLLNRFPALASFLSIFFGVWATYLIVSEMTRSMAVVVASIFAIALSAEWLLELASGAKESEEFVLAPHWRSSCFGRQLWL